MERFLRIQRPNVYEVWQSRSVFSMHSKRLHFERRKGEIATIVYYSLLAIFFFVLLVYYLATPTLIVREVKKPTLSQYEAFIAASGESSRAIVCDCTNARMRYSEFHQVVISQDEICTNLGLVLRACVRSATLCRPSPYHGILRALEKFCLLGDESLVRTLNLHRSQEFVSPRLVSQQDAREILNRIIEDMLATVATNVDVALTSAVTGLHAERPMTGFSNVDFDQVYGMPYNLLNRDLRLLCDMVLDETLCQNRMWCRWVNDSTSGGKCIDYCSSRAPDPSESCPQTCSTSDFCVPVPWWPDGEGFTVEDLYKWENISEYCVALNISDCGGDYCKVDRYCETLPCRDQPEHPLCNGPLLALGEVHNNVLSDDQLYCTNVTSCTIPTLRYCISSMWDSYGNVTRCSYSHEAGNSAFYKVKSIAEEISDLRSPECNCAEDYECSISGGESYFADDDSIPHYLNVSEVPLDTLLSDLEQYRLYLTRYCSAVDTALHLPIAFFNNHISMVHWKIQMGISGLQVGRVSSSSEGFAVEGETISGAARSGFVNKSSVVSDLLYEQYYDRCQPSLCSYVVRGNRSFTETIVAVIGLLGGLTVILQRIVGLAFSFWKPPDTDNDTGLSQLSKNTKNSGSSSRRRTLPPLPALPERLESASSYPQVTDEI